MGVNLDHGQCPLVKAVWVGEGTGGRYGYVVPTGEKPL